VSHARRWGLALAMAVMLTACAPPEPTVPATSLPIATIPPTQNPLLQSATLTLEDLGWVGPDARPRLRVGADGTAHLMWLDRRAGGSSLLYRQWTVENGWSEVETWQVWERAKPIQWDMVLDGSGIPHALWSEPGRLTHLRRSGPGAWHTDDVPLALGGGPTSREYATDFGFAVGGSAFYVVYRDTAPEVPNFRLGYSPNTGKDWEEGEVIFSDPGAPTQVHTIGLTVSQEGVVHLIMNAQGDQIYLHAQSGALDRWRGLAGGQDLFEQGKLGRDVVLDAHGFPHVLLESSGMSYYRFWDGRAWAGLESALLGAAGGSGDMAFALGPDDVAWVIGTAPPGILRGLWLRTFKGRDASQPALLKEGNVTECAIAIGQGRVHVVAVIDGALWHVLDQVEVGYGLPRQQLE
jgi:hypothetical protein